MPSLEHRAAALAIRPPAGAGELRRFAEAPVAASELSALMTADPSRPYGRRVLVGGPHCEVMVATWTRDRACAPHDHGGSRGVVRVLRGAAVHTVWRLVGGELVAVGRERLDEGAILSCGPDLVHSMVDAGDAHALVTLHAYVDPIASMTVYDLDHRRTLVVSGACGAWVPDAELILAEYTGFQAVRDQG